VWVGTEVIHLKKKMLVCRPADVEKEREVASLLELRNQSRDQKGIYPDLASGKRRFESGS